MTSLWAARLKLLLLTWQIEIVRIGADIRLSLNVSKCELIAHNDFVVNDNLLQSFSRTNIEDATLLGAPLFAGPALDKAWTERCVISLGQLID